MNYTLTIQYRTKAEAKQAVKDGETPKIMNEETGMVYTRMNGSEVPIVCKLDHYKEWIGTASVWNGCIDRIR